MRRRIFYGPGPHHGPPAAHGDAQSDGERSPGKSQHAHKRTKRTTADVAGAASTDVSGAASTYVGDAKESSDRLDGKSHAKICGANIDCSRHLFFSMSVEIVSMTENHWPSVSEIYRAGIVSGNATFETEVPGWEQWETKHLGFARLVAIVDGEVKGWAALTPVSTRKVYQGVAENSVYVALDAQGLGLGRRLLEGLIAESEANGIWTLQNSIFPENVASLQLHRSCGFREVGRRERIAQLNGVWRDT